MGFALLGNIAFDLLNAPSAFDENQSATFAEHEVLSGKPRLQAMGDNLTELRLQLQLHHQLGNVEARYQALSLAKAKQEPLALVLGQQQFKGHFVITELSSQTLLTDNEGNALARDVSLTLREFIGNVGQGILGAALSLGGNSPLATLLPPSFTQFVSKATEWVNKGIKIYRQTRQVIRGVRDAISVIKAVARNPLEAIALVPAVVSQLGGAVGGLAEMVGLGDTFRHFTHQLKGGEAFLTGMVDLAEQIQLAHTEFKRGLNERHLGQWFDFGVKAIESAEAITQSLATPAAQLTAWIAVRGDEPNAASQAVVSS